MAATQSAARHLDGGSQRINRLVLTKHHGLEIAIQRLQGSAVVRGDILRRDACNLGDDVLNLLVADNFLLLGFRQNTLCSTGLIDDVNRLVRQMTCLLYTSPSPRDG